MIPDWFHFQKQPQTVALVNNCAKKNKKNSEEVCVIVSCLKKLQITDWQFTTREESR